MAAVLLIVTVISVFAATSLVPDVWQPTTSTWINGNAQGYAEGNVVPIRLQITDTDGTTVPFSVCLDKDVASNGAIAFTDVADWNETHQPTVTPPTPVLLSSPAVDGFRIQNGTINSVSFVGESDGSSGFECLSDYLEWQLSVTLPTNAGNGAEETAVLVYGARLAAPGASIRGGGTVPAGKGASAVNGTFQIQIANGGRETINFRANDIAPAGNLRISISPLNDTNEVNDQHTFTVTVEQSTAPNVWTPVQGATPVVTITPNTYTPVSNSCAVGTNASGQCTVVINSTAPAVYTASAEVTVNVSGTDITRETGTQANTDAGGSGDATKRYVDLRIFISPNDETNEVGVAHIFTVKVEQNDGTGWTAVQGASPVVTVTPTPDTPPGVCGPTNAGGECTVTINSTTPGTFSASASVTVSVNGVSITRETGTTANTNAQGSGDASKTYADLRISIDPLTDTNEVNDDHVFTITVEQSTEENVWVPVANGTTVAVTFNPNTVVPTADDCAAPGTVAGVCTVTINSSTPGVITASAGATVNVDGASISRETGTAANTAAGGTGDATKTYVDLRISIDPLTDTNRVGEEHTFTILVEQNNGTGGWTAVENAVPTVTVSPLPSSLTDNCDPAGTDANGTCTVVINSDTAGQFTATAEVTVTVGGVSITRTTGTTANLAAFGSVAGEVGDDAEKIYVDLRISIDPLTDTNSVNDPHTFTVKVEQNDGSGWTAVAGVNPTVSVSPAPTSQTNNCDLPDATNANGECTFVINNNAAGTFTLTAAITHTVGGLSITRSTDDDPANLAAGGTGDATKDYVEEIDDYRISIDPLDATNTVGEAHTFTITVERNQGQGWNPVPGVNPTVSFNPNVTIDDNTCDPPDGTDAAGQCTVTINSTVPQTIEAEAEIVISDTITRTTGTEVNTNLGGSENAFKTYVNLRISISPDDATNVAGDNHIFTVLVEKNEGTGSGWEPVPGVNPAVLVSPNPDSKTDDCAAFGTNASGECDVTINSASPGVFTASASVTATVDGEEITRSTTGDAANLAAGGSGNATKTYVDLRISIDPLDATNNVNEPHTFTILVEQNDGSGWTDVSGATPVVTITPNTYTPVSDTCAAPGTDANGECEVTINSAVPAVYLASAEVTVTVGGLPITRETGTAANTNAGGSGDATKTYQEVYIILTPSYLVTRVIEGKLTGVGSKACYWITLSGQPSGNVVIDIDPNDLLSEVTIDKSQITLDATNWNSLTLANRSNFLCVRAVDDKIDEPETEECGDKSADLTSAALPYSQECGDHKEFVEHTVNAATTDPAYTNTTPWINRTLTFLGRPAENYLEALVRDNDTAAVILTESFAVTDLDEAGTPVGKACYWVTLASNPAAPVTVNITPDNTEVTTNKTSVVLDSSNWNQIDTSFGNKSNFVCVTPIDEPDIDPANPQCFTGAASLLGAAGTGTERCGTHLGSIAHVAVSVDPKYNATSNFTGNGPDFDSDPSTIDVLVRNDDVAALAFEPATVNLLEGDEVTFDVRLSSRPAAAVVVSSEQTNLTFQPPAWNVPQTVTIRTEQNNTADAPLTLLFQPAVTSSDPNFAGLAPEPVEVTVIDDDTPGVFLSSTSIEVTETGQTATYEVYLTSQPKAEVTVSLATDSQLQVQPATMTFSPGNWNQPQTVTVTAVNDRVAETAPHTGRISHQVASSDGSYAGLTVADIAAVIGDDDAAAVLVENAVDLAVSEGSPSTAGYRLVLQSQPAADVVVTINSGGQVKIEPATVTFTATNWDQPQTVTVTAIDNAVDEGMEYAAALTHKASSADPFYDSYETEWVNVKVVDNDVAGVTLSKAAMSIGAGQTGTYTIVLNTRPTMNVVVDLVAGGSVTATGADCVAGDGGASCVLFTPGNWNQPQTVTVKANGSGRIDHRVTSGDSIYMGLSVHPMLVNEVYSIFVPISGR